MSSPRWGDGELLHELRAALQELPVDESVIRAAQAAFTWRTVDADLGSWAWMPSPSWPSAGPRAAGRAHRARWVFHGKRLSVKVEIDDIGIVGHLSPPQPAQVTLVTADGPQATTQADEVGWFTFPLPTPGPLRLDCRLGADHLVTEWVTV